MKFFGKRMRRHTRGWQYSRRSIAASVNVWKGIGGQWTDSLSIGSTFTESSRWFPTPEEAVRAVEDAARTLRKNLKVLIPKGTRS